ncbi:uncharacterized protein LOC125068141 isoform X2 [Vanessa atalanta]|uniref:uncharacterized protein LOC125068141 isoform X2 n=1 Tax=Vanessa atalanta TaxID=42275 RepID=UPI001FCD14FF|nr:uncharacterized protein LOC125068141 isoform X2 [Vanessa atalanta]
MMRAAGAVALAVATLLVCCSADLHQDQDMGVGEHRTGDYDNNDSRQKEEVENFLRFLMQYENQNGDKKYNYGRIGGSTLLGRDINSYDSGSLGRVSGGLGGSTLLGRSIDSDTRHFNRIGGSTLLGRNVDYKMPYARFLDPLGGGNFVRNLDPIGGGNLVRNLDSIGGSNFVKKNLDQIGGPNLVKRTLDSLGGGNFPRNLDALGGGHLAREVRELRRFPYFMGRRFEYGSPYGGKRDPWPLASPIEYGYYGEGLPKRNFDEIDRSNLDNFVKKRNFDEIDHTSMPFPFKRFYHLYGPNNLDTPVSSFDKKRYRPDYPMDEIDLSQFPIGSKRAYEFPAAHPLR